MAHGLRLQKPPQDTGRRYGRRRRITVAQDDIIPTLFSLTLTLYRSPAQGLAAAARVTGFWGGMGNLSAPKGTGMDYHAKLKESVKS